MTIDIEWISLDIGFFVNPLDEATSSVVDAARTEFAKTFDTYALSQLLSNGEVDTITVDSANDYPGFKNAIVGLLRKCLNDSYTLEPGVHLLKGPGSVVTQDSSRWNPVEIDQLPGDLALLSRGDYGGTRCSWSGSDWVDTREITLKRGYNGAAPSEWKITHGGKTFFVTALLTYYCPCDSQDGRAERGASSIRASEVHREVNRSHGIQDPQARKASSRGSRPRMPKPRKKSI